MKHEGPDLPLAGMNRGLCGVKILLSSSTSAVDSPGVSRCRNLTDVEAMILRLRNFGKG
jgi:hypothetical protein